tara:strand:- start:182 stop:349 length:168 start_codon:yes stop_codon:yes gene_type:complete
MKENNTFLNFKKKKVTEEPPVKKKAGKLSVKVNRIEREIETMKEQLRIVKSRLGL